jgi:hypothetical protein
MMSEKNKIDEIFRNALGDFQESKPSRKVWAGISIGVFFSSIIRMLLSSFANNTIAWIIGSLFIIGPSTYFIVKPPSDSKETHQIKNVLMASQNKAEKPSVSDKLNTNKKENNTINHQRENLSNAKADKINKQKIVAKSKGKVEINKTSLAANVDQNKTAINNNTIKKNVVKTKTLDAKMNIHSLTNSIDRINSDLIPIKTGRLNNILSDLDSRANEKTIDFPRVFMLQKTDSASSIALHNIKNFQKDSAQRASKYMDSLIANMNDSLARIKLKTKGSFTMEELRTYENPWSLYFHSSLSNVSKKMNGPGIYDSYFNKRKASEEAVNRMGAGVDLRCSFSRYLYLQTGLNYASYGEKADYLIKKFIAIDSSSSITDSVFNYYVARSNNRFSYLEVPLILGFKYTTNYTTYYAGAGASFGWLMFAKGALISKDDVNSPISFKNARTSPFERTSMSYLIHVGASFRISDQISVYAEPFFKHHTQSVFLKSYGIGQRYSTFGINLGIKFDLQ